MRITNGKLLTMENGVAFDRGFVDFENGVITACGDAKDAPDACGEVLDAQGGYILPGFIDAHCHIGIYEEAVRWEGEDANEITDPVTPQLRAIDAVYPFDIAFKKALRGGVTSAVVGPGSANVIGGQMVFMKMLGDSVDEMIVKNPCSMKMATGENPKNCYGQGGKKAPMTRMATASILRESLIQTQKYIEKKNGGEKIYDAKWEALIPVLEGKLPAHIHSHRADDILTVIRICKEFNLKYNVIHCTDGNAVKGYIKNAGFMPVIGPGFHPASKPETLHCGMETPGQLYNAGIEVAITVDHPILPLQYLSVIAATAVKEGMPVDAALRAITINSAIAGGCEDRVGSIKAGKDADICVYNKHPFEYDSQTTAVFVSGRRAL